MSEKVRLSNAHNTKTTASEKGLTKKQIVIWNLVGFEFIHFVLEVAASTSSNSHHNIGATVVINYLISYWIIKSQINQKSKKELIGYTWLIALVVFGARVLLGVLFAELMR